MQPRFPHPYNEANIVGLGHDCEESAYQKLKLHILFLALE